MALWLGEASSPTHVGQGLWNAQLGKFSKPFLQRSMPTTMSYFKKHQYAERSGRTTEETMLKLVERIYVTWRQGRILSVVFIGIIKGAFSNVHNVRLIYNSCKVGIDL